MSGMMQEIQAVETIDTIYTDDRPLEEIQTSLRYLVAELNTRLDTLQQQIFERDNSDEAVDFEK